MPSCTDPLVLRGRIIGLLENVAFEKRKCKACGVVIYFVKTKDGRTIPFTAEGVNHYQDCAQFEKQRAAAEPAQKSLLDKRPEGLEPRR